jgi:hypothetical protein
MMSSSAFFEPMVLSTLFADIDDSLTATAANETLSGERAPLCRFAEGLVTLRHWTSSLRNDKLK